MVIIGGDTLFIRGPFSKNNEDMNSKTILQADSSKDDPRDIAFFASGDITIYASLPIEDVIAVVAAALQIPPFTLDTSGRWEEVEVYTSRCLGLEFMLCTIKPAKYAESEFEYGVSIFTRTNFKYDGTEREIDVAPYCAYLLGVDQRLRVTAGPA